MCSSDCMCLSICLFVAAEQRLNANSSKMVNTTDVRVPRQSWYVSCTLTTSRSLLSIKVIGQWSRSHGLFVCFLCALYCSYSRTVLSFEQGLAFCLFYFIVNMITHKLLLLVRWKFALTCTLTQGWHLTWVKLVLPSSVGKTQFKPSKSV